MADFQKWRRSESAQGLFLISPTLGFALLLLAVPLIMVVALSFWTQDYLTLDRTFTTANYQTAWTEPMYQYLMARSLKISIFVTAVTVLVAYPVAYFISFHVAPKRKAMWIFLITIPFWTSYLMRIFLWKVILGYNGVINGTLTGLGIIDEPLSFILYNQNAGSYYSRACLDTLSILPIFVALERVDRSLIEAAEDLGDSGLRRFFRVTLPLSMPGVIAATIIVFIPTIGDYVTPRLVGGPNGLMISNMIELQFKKANNAPLGAALAISAMGIVTFFALVFLWMNRKYVRGPS